MKSAVPKVLHKLGDEPMLGRVMRAVATAGVSRQFIIVGHQAEQVRAYVGDRADCVLQPALRGTADAVWQVRDQAVFADPQAQVLVVYGDTPLLTASTISRLLAQHEQDSAYCTLLTAVVPDPTSYGRIVRDPNDKLIAIVEERDATVYQKAIKEINAGVYVFNAGALFAALREIQPKNAQQEFYLTDVITIFRKKEYPLSCVRVEQYEEIIGVNSRDSLVQAHAILRQRVAARLMDDGVTIIDPQTTYIHETACIGRDTVIQPLTVIGRDVVIGQRCSVGPFCHVRAGCRIADDVSLGNFAEINRSQIGSGARVKHQSYIGDAEIGEQVNIGAGTIIANYDGKHKHKTVVGRQAFIGTGTILVAPVKIGIAAVTGAGSVVTKNKDVPDNTVVVGVPAKPLVKKGS